MNISSEQYSKEAKEIKAKKKQAIVDLDIRKFGPCPHYKGHFDIDSFYVGMLTGFIVGMIFVSFVSFVH